MREQNTTRMKQERAWSAGVLEGEADGMPAVAHGESRNGP